MNDDSIINNKFFNDNIIHDSADNIGNVILSPQESTKIIFQYFSDIQMKGHTDKCHLVMVEAASGGVL